MQKKENHFLWEQSNYMKWLVDTNETERRRTTTMTEMGKLELWYYNGRVAVSNLMVEHELPPNGKMARVWQYLLNQECAALKAGQ